MSTSVKMIIEEDCTLILERALLRQTLCAFGEDGFGLYGKSDTPVFYDVVDLRVDIEADDDHQPTVVSGTVSICLRGYDADVVGHIQTDRNFDIALKVVLTAAGVSPKSLIWASINEQAHGCVTFYIDVAELLGW